MELAEWKLPADPLLFIQECVRDRRVFWTYHANIHLKGRFVRREAVFSAVESYEIIEAYPEDKYLPSYLVLAKSADQAFHVLFAADVAEGNVRVVTVYNPSDNEWEDDLRTRRAPR